jgi:hypothetical protein
VMDYKFECHSGQLITLTVPSERDENQRVVHGLSQTTARRLYQELGDALLLMSRNHVPIINVAREMVQP